MKRLTRVPVAAVLLCIVGLVLFLAGARGAEVRLTPPPKPVLQSVSPFQMTGFIQKATVDAAGDIFSGGTVLLNGYLVTIPRNTLVEMPAASLTWGEIFTLAPPPYAGAGQSGLAMSDSPAPLTTYEITVIGNRIVRSATDDKYVAGLVMISQQSANVAQGFINAIDYANGELLVGTTFGAAAGARVRINDPNGRFGKAHSPDVRLAVDDQNPTVAARTGFPMCIPRTDPAVSDDALCPQRNRPVDPVTKAYQTIYTMPPPAPVLLPADPDATQQTPFEVGDYITYVGTLTRDPACAATAANNCQYIAAHTITANLGIFTAPGTMPVYLRIEDMSLGVAGLPNPLFPQEAVEKLVVTAFSTDPTALVDIFAMDVDACGKQSDRFYSTADPSGPPAGALKGRARVQLQFGDFLPATREIRVASRTFTNGFNVDIALPTAKTYANGLLAGQFHAPNFKFIFPENLVVGSPPVPLPLQEFPFLANGTGPYAGTGAAGAGAKAPGSLRQLSPWPGLAAPAALGCGPSGVLLPPFAVTGPNQTVPSGSQVILDGSGSSDPNTPPLPLSYTWLQTGGQAVALQDNGFVNPFFTAPNVGRGMPPMTLTFSLVVSNGYTSSTISTVTVTVTEPQKPAIGAGAPQSVNPGAPVTLTGTATDPNGTTALPLYYQWMQVGGPTAPLSNAYTLTPTFTAPTLAAGQGPQILTFLLTVTDSLNLQATATTTVTVQAAGNSPGPQSLVVNAGAPQSVSSAGGVTLIGSAADASGAAGLPLTFQWTQTAGTPVTLANANTPNATFTVPTVAPGQAAQTLTFSLTVTNKLGASATSTTTVTVAATPAANTPQNPAVNAGAPQSVGGGAAVSLTGTATDPNGAAGLPLTLQWTQTAGAAVTVAGANTLTPTFTAPAIAAGQAAQTLTFSLTATDKLGKSATATTTVTVQPADVVTIASAVYTQSTSRLQVTAKSSLTNGLPVLTLHIPGGPDVVLTLDTLTAVYSVPGGVPNIAAKPASVSVTSSFGGSATGTVANSGATANPTADIPGPPGSLKLVAAPLPPNIADFIVDKTAAIALGKALFWDQQAGSDGMACGSCHFHAGADNRVKNTLSPGLRNQLGGAVSQTFNLTASNRSNTVGPPPGGGPNYTLKLADFPFHQLKDPTNANSQVVFDTDDIAGSNGVFPRNFVSPGLPHTKGDNCTSQSSIFSVRGINVRQVEPRNTPTVINAIYNFRSFWDGRANNIFNGRTPFGARDAAVGVDPLNSIMVADNNGNLTPVMISILDASLASQSVGPPLSNLEMSCGGRLFEHIAHRLLPGKPLEGQTVDPTDSVLGAFADTAGGLSTDYATLIKRAFQPRFWSSTQKTADGFTQMEKNFSLFWGLSIMLYESTLVSDDTPYDRYVAGDTQAMTQQQVDGFLQVFMGKGGCVMCHKGAEFTGAAGALRTNRELGALVEHMVMGDGTAGLYDSGFYNIGVRPTVEDIGAGGTDPFGNPLSWSRQAKAASVGTGPVTDLANILPDGFNVFTCNFEVDPCSPITGSFRDAVDGSFKVPTLRNVELTGPYFHNGGQATLEQVVDFYNRGGDATGPDGSNTTGYGPNPTNRAAFIGPLHLSDTDKANLVAFLKALTDDRVRWEKAPFDHPSVQIPNGHPFDETQVLQDGSSGQAVDSLMLIPAVGAQGRAARNLPALLPFVAGLQ
ncbi:MAG: hypothetical protein LAP87_10325 [Acidobacteriia bacterium]|nr:hypothetical protein [Terriglobia bacterium]